MCHFERNGPRSWSIISWYYTCSWRNSSTFPSQPLQVVYRWCLYSVAWQCHCNVTCTYPAKSRHRKGRWHKVAVSLDFGDSFCISLVRMLSERGTYAFAASPCSCRANLQPYRPNLACSKKASERPSSDCACPHVLLCLSIRLLPLIEVTPRGNLYVVLTTSLYLCHYASFLNGVQLLPTLLCDQALWGSA